MNGNRQHAAQHRQKHYGQIRAKRASEQIKGLAKCSAELCAVRTYCNRLTGKIVDVRMKNDDVKRFVDSDGHVIYACGNNALRERKPCDCMGKKMWLNSWVREQPSERLDETEQHRARMLAEDRDYQEVLRRRQAVEDEEARIIEQQVQEQEREDREKQERIDKARFENEQRELNALRAEMKQRDDEAAARIEKLKQERKTREQNTTDYQERARIENKWIKLETDIEDGYNLYLTLNLNLTDNITQKDIRNAYLKAAKSDHPDKHSASQTSTQKDRKTANFRDVKEAYEILYDPETRARYDELVASVWRECGMCDE